MKFAHIQIDNSIIVLANQYINLRDEICSDWFSPTKWQNERKIIGQSKGRNITHFIRYQNQEWVLRHYYRGGLMGRINRESYFYLNVKNTRCFQEMKLLDWMKNHQLPVPSPIACHIQKSGIFYHADIIVEKIPKAFNLVEYLSQSNLAPEKWRQMGEMLANFHNKGINHTDLNANNILIDSKGNFWLIDFDKCDRRIPGRKWQQSNIERLLRSFKKEELRAGISFCSKNWNQLKHAYFQSLKSELT